MPETQNTRNDNAHEQGIRFLSLLNLMTLTWNLKKGPGFSARSHTIFHRSEFISRFLANILTAYWAVGNAFLSRIRLEGHTSGQKILLSA